MQLGSWGRRRTDKCLSVPSWLHNTYQATGQTSLGLPILLCKRVITPSPQGCCLDSMRCLRPVLASPTQLSSHKTKLNFSQAVSQRPSEGHWFTEAASAPCSQYRLWSQTCLALTPGTTSLEDGSGPPFCHL